MVRKTSIIVLREVFAKPEKHFKANLKHSDLNAFRRFWKENWRRKALYFYSQERSRECSGRSLALALYLEVNELLLVERRFQRRPYGAAGFTRAAATAKMDEPPEKAYVHLDVNRHTISIYESRISKNAGRTLPINSHPTKTAVTDNWLLRLVEAIATRRTSFIRRLRGGSGRAARSLSCGRWPAQHAVPKARVAPARARKNRAPHPASPPRFAAPLCCPAYQRQLYLPQPPTATRRPRPPPVVPPFPSASPARSPYPLAAATTLPLPPTAHRLHRSAPRATPRRCTPPRCHLRPPLATFEKCKTGLS
ncbi:Protein of unknown function [Gryllus bimaculatus]|nr:Protein of unknown function [Gryllus bimaculatus]